MATLSWDEKIAKATETATKKAEKEGLDTAATKTLIDGAVQKVLETKSREATTKYTITVDNNATFCGIGAGGVQFANGKAIIENKRMAGWFEEHEGYSVEIE